MSDSTWEYRLRLNKILCQLLKHLPNPCHKKKRVPMRNGKHSQPSDPLRLSWGQGQGQERGQDDCLTASSKDVPGECCAQLTWPPAEWLWLSETGLLAYSRHAAAT